ncbi:hypothetical protein GGI43DRAFT_366286 [Trichoderma evansii]
MSSRKPRRWDCAIYDPRRARNRCSRERSGKEQDEETLEEKETKEGRDGGGGALKKRERTGIRQKSGALEVVGLFSSFLLSEQSRRLPRWAGGSHHWGIPMARHRQPYLDLDTSILQYILSISVVFSRRVSSATSQLAGLFAAAVLLRELSSRGADVSGQREPARQFVIDRHPTSRAAPHVYAMRALYSPQVGSSTNWSPRRSASTKTCKQGMYASMSFRPPDALPRLNDRCPLDLDSKEKKKYCPPDHPPWPVLVVSTTDGAWSIMDVLEVLRTRSIGPVS